MYYQRGEGERKNEMNYVVVSPHQPPGCPTSSGLYFCFSPSGKSFLKHWTNLTQTGDGRTLPCNTERTGAGVQLKL